MYTAEAVYYRGTCALPSHLYTLQGSPLICVTKSMQIVVEPSGAVALAAALSKQIHEVAGWEEIQNAGIILSGGNADIAAKGFWQLWTL